MYFLSEPVGVNENYGGGTVEEPDGVSPPTIRTLHTPASYPTNIIG